MNRSELRVGLEAELHWRVSSEHVVHLGDRQPAGSGFPSVTVFSTPNMILLMERTARKVLEPFLMPGEESVGAMVDVEHLAGTPIGSWVRGIAKVTRVEGKQVEFKIEAYDAEELLGRGTHRRAIVPLAKLAQRISQKSQRLRIGSVIPMQIAPNSGSLPGFRALELEIQGEIAIVWMNRPSKRNAINVAMTEDWEQLNAWLSGHPEIRVVLITGNGDSFSAGDDVIEVGTLPMNAAQELSYRQARAYLAWEQLPQIMLAAVHGDAFGAGCVVACACDFRFAAFDARFGMPEILLGWPPGYGIAQLTALVGKSMAMKMCVTGQSISAREAADCGLVHTLVARGELMGRTLEFAKSLLHLPAQALRETKRLIHHDEGVQPKSAYLADTAAYIHCLERPDAREGIVAFSEKRKPRFNAKQ